MPSTYNLGTSVKPVPTFTLGVVSSVVGAVLAALVIEPALSTYDDGAVAGVVGAVVSTVTVNAGLCPLSLPALSVSV